MLWLCCWSGLWSRVVQGSGHTGSFWVYVVLGFMSGVCILKVSVLV